MFNAPEAASVTGPRLVLVRQDRRQYAGTGGTGGAPLAKPGSQMIPEETCDAIAKAEA